jgi:thiosulfate/3-mercaptopyruvate sulfurtransferase
MTIFLKTSHRSLLFARSPRRAMSSAAPLLLSPKEVNLLKQSPTPISILDATWFMPNVARNATDEFLSKRIPGAQFLDLDDVASPHELGLKHMMPDQKKFSQACGRTLLVLPVICFF